MQFSNATKDIKYNDETHLFDMILCGTVVDSALTYHEADNKFNISMEYINKLSDDSLMQLIGVKIVKVNGDISVVRIQELPRMRIEIRVPIREWCLNRIKSRMSHKGVPIRSQGSGMTIVGYIRRLG